MTENGDVKTKDVKTTDADDGMRLAIWMWWWRVGSCLTGR